MSTPDGIRYPKEPKRQKFSLGGVVQVRRVVIKLSTGVALEPAAPQKSQSLDGEGEPW